MKLLYGTGNPAKLQHMRKLIDGLDIEIIGMNDIDLNAKEIDESGNSPLENAKIKALSYYRATKMPVFSCDSGLYIEGLDDKEQPGVYIRRVNGKVLNDEEMIDCYSRIALKLGGQAKVMYKNAICLVYDEENIFEYDGDDIGSEHFIITSRVHPKRIAGFPLDSISLDIDTGEYYMDIEGNISIKNENKVRNGFKSFFERVIKAKP